MFALCVMTAAMNRKNDGESILRRMFHRCVFHNYLGAMTLMINTAADGLIISHFLGSQATAAFGLIFPVYSLISFFPSLLRTAAQVNLGKTIGRGDLDSANRCLFSLLAFGLAAALPFVLLLTHFRGHALKILCIQAYYSEAILSLASDYLLWLAPAVFPLMLCSVLHPIMQMGGDAARSPRAIQIAAVVNLSGDMMNALLFHGGMAGMALATTLSCYCELFVLSLHFRSQRAILHPSAGGGLSLKQLILLSEGIPPMLRDISAFLSGILINRLASGLGGENAVAVLAVGSSVWVFLLPAASAVSGACTTLGSVSFGEADSHAFQTVFLLGIRYCFLPCAAYSLVFVAAAKPLALFCSGGGTQMLSAALPYLRILALSLPFVCFCQTIEAQLNVLGKTRRSALLSIADGGPLVLAASWMLSRFMGLNGLWLGRFVGSIALSLLALLFVFRLFFSRGGKWNLLSQSFVTNPDAFLESTVATEEEVTAFSELLRTSFMKKGVSPRNCTVAALCVEELACNTLRWGYGTGENNRVDIRAVYRGGEVIVRLRDSGIPFNPEQYVRQFQTEVQNPSKNVGLRIVAGCAADMRYIPLADCNVVILRI